MITLAVGQPVAGLLYNANNQLTQLSGINLIYDANGNMTSDGVHAYSWDATNFLYDGANAVQELSVGMPAAIY